MTLLRSAFLRCFWQRWGFALLTAGSLCASQAQGFRLESAGARGGASLSEGAGRNFHQAEAFVNWNLPWRWVLGANWWLQSRLDASAGWLGSSFNDAFIGTVGPSLLLRRERFPLSDSLGFSPTLLGQR